MAIKKGDTVQIMAGKDRGKTGPVLKVFPKQNRILVEGFNVYKKHMRPKREGEKGQIVNVSRSVAGSNVMLYCGNCKKGVRVGYTDIGEKTKRRICAQCKNNL